MNTFKIEKIITNNKKLNPKQQKPEIKVQINKCTINIFNYPDDNLLDIIELYFQDDVPHLNITIKALTIISYNAKNISLWNKLNKLLKSHLSDQQRIYNIFCEWYGILYQSMYKVYILQELEMELQIKIIIILLRCFFTSYHGNDKYILSQINILIIVQHQQLYLNEIKNKYIQQKKPLKQLLNQIRRVGIQKNQQFFKNLVQYAVHQNQSQISLIIQNNQMQHIVNFVFSNYASLGEIFIKYIKYTFKIDAFLRNYCQIGKLKSLYNIAVRQWINDNNYKNLWNIINFYYNRLQYRSIIHQLGAQVIHQEIFNQLIIIYYLYKYFNSSYYNFVQEDQWSKQINIQIIYQINKTITFSQNYEHFTLILLNNTYAPKKWKKCNPFLSKNKWISKQVRKYKTWFEKIEQQNQKINKKIQLCYSVFLVKMKDNNKIICVSYQQLEDYCEKGKQFNNQNYQIEYASLLQIETNKIFKKSQEQQQQHPIILQAKIIRLLKKHKYPLNQEIISQKTKIQLNKCQIILRKLIIKGYVQQSKNNDGYLYLP